MQKKVLDGLKIPELEEIFTAVTTCVIATRVSRYVNSGRKPSEGVEKLFGETVYK